MMHGADAYMRGPRLRLQFRGLMNDVAVNPVNPARVVHARYTLKERIGTGGQGEVWRARDVQRNADVALKILHPAASELAAARVALEREHVINSRLDHPHILKVFAPEEATQGPMLPMELAMGGDLRQLRGAGYLAVVPVLIEVAEALAHAHERGVVHRDLKPGNVLFDARGSAKLADFGLAGTPLASGVDAAQGASPFSASPQQLRGEPPVPADDIYGLGALAYELLSGRPPYYPRFDSRRVQNDPVPELVPTEPIPPRLAALIRQMLEKDPKARPANMSEVAEAFDLSLNDTLSFDFETAEAPRDAEPAARTGRHPALVAAEAPPAPPPPAAAPPARVVAEVPRAPPTPRVAAVPPLTTAPAPPPPPDTPEPGALDGPALWDDLRLGPGPGLPSSIEPMRGGRWRLAWVVGAAVAAAIAFYALPHPDWLTHRVAPRSQEGTAPGASATAAAPATPSAADVSALRAERAAFDRRFAALKARGAATWDANDLSAARDRAAESTGAFDAGSVSLARARLAAATQLLDAVERTAPAAAPAPPVKEMAAASAPQGDTAAAAATRDEAYARAAGEGFAALGAGRLAEARTAFDRARAIRPNGPEALDGLRRVSAAEGTSAANTSLKTHGEELEAQERWDEAVAAYAAALREHPGLAFAQAGKTRASERARLDHSLQGLLDQPEQLSDPAVRAQAAAWLANAQATTPAGPVLRSQIARLQILLPEYDKPVRVSLVSDSATQVAILSVGNFGSFDHRDVELKPGTYTVIGSRVGYRDVRREITVTPGDRQTVSVSCYDPI